MITTFTNHPRFIKQTTQKTQTKKRLNISARTDPHCSAGFLRQLSYLFHYLIPGLLRTFLENLIDSEGDLDALGVYFSHGLYSRPGGFCSSVYGICRFGNARRIGQLGMTNC